MHIHRQTLPIQPQTICWYSNGLIDWATGTRYDFNGHREDVRGCIYSGLFDRVITSANGTYIFLYQNLGTKGLLLKDGDLLREINRSNYHADDYEYPAAFATVAGTTYLIHCPLDYRRLDFEEVETGVLITDVPGREPRDFFHSRLEVSPGGRFLLSKGWCWHPWDMVEAFDIKACLNNPLLLDSKPLEPAVGTEVSTAGFLDEELVLLGTSSEEAMDEDLEAALPPHSIAFWNIRTNEVSPPVRVVAEFGNLFPLSKTMAWDLYQYPKLLDLTTGEVVASLPELPSGEQRSAIIRGNTPAIVFDRLSGRIAFTADSQLQVLSWSH